MAAQRLVAEILRWTPKASLNAAQALDRSYALPLAAPSTISPNGSCRLIPAQDGWIAVNLARSQDLELIPAWIGCDLDRKPWQAITDAATGEPTARLIERGSELGLPVAWMGEASPQWPRKQFLGTNARLPGKLRVIDFSALWAGPLCGAILALAGHEVIKVESAIRPDSVRAATPLLDKWLNGNKLRQTLPAFGNRQLSPLLAEADVIITSARPRAFDAIGITPARLFAANPALIWVAITAYGWTGNQAMRVGFGDDVAVAGGLVDWEGGMPRFAGDAVADPLSGLAAALASLEAIADGGGVLIDVAMAGVAAAVAAP